MPNHSTARGRENRSSPILTKKYDGRELPIGLLPSGLSTRMKITANEEYGLRCLLRLARLDGRVPETPAGLDGRPVRDWGARSAPPLAAQHPGDRGGRGAVDPLRGQVVAAAAAGRFDRERPRQHRRLSPRPAAGRHPPRRRAAGPRRTAVRRRPLLRTPRRPRRRRPLRPPRPAAPSAPCGGPSKAGSAAPSTRSPSPTCWRARAASPTCCASGCGRRS